MNDQLIQALIDGDVGPLFTIKRCALTALGDDVILTLDQTAHPFYLGHRNREIMEERFGPVMGRWVGEAIRLDLLGTPDDLSLIVGGLQ